MSTCHQFERVVYEKCINENGIPSNFRVFLSSFCCAGIKSGHTSALIIQIAEILHAHSATMRLACPRMSLIRREHLRRHSWTATSASDLPDHKIALNILQPVPSEVREGRTIHCDAEITITSQIFSCVTISLKVQVEIISDDVSSSIFYFQERQQSHRTCRGRRHSTCEGLTQGGNSPAALDMKRTERKIASREDDIAPAVRINEPKIAEPDSPNRFSRVPVSPRTKVRTTESMRRRFGIN
jgi:hypothetical protein